ncbi:MAG: hypothetical protein LBL79_01230, partial [Prevotella sp.]|nr:hypothetical protein [Prevotella sp.]
MAKTLTIAGLPTGATWTAAASQTWVTLSKASGTGNGTLDVSAAGNTGASRTATVTITTADGFTATVNISQAAG